MSSQQNWLDYVRSTDSLGSELRDPIDKTRDIIIPRPMRIWEWMFAPEWLGKHSIPTIVIDGYSANDLDPLSEITLAFEMMFRRLFNDSDEVVFGEPAQATKWVSGTAPTE